MSYDPSLNLVYYGTSNPGPWNAEQRPGDNKYTAGVFARDADTGEAVWFYQMSPHDLWDYDGVNEQVLVDLPINGTMRKTMLRADRDGYLYVMDRTTGEVISADPFVHVTSTTGIDLKSGKPLENEAKKPSVGTVVRDVCPASPGGKDWQPTAYSPKTGYLYIPANNLCMVIFAMPSVVTASAILLLDRLVGTQFYNPAEGGDNLLWQHLFWFFGHPEVYIIFVPALGMVSAIVATFTQRPIFGYRAMVLSLVATGFIGFGLWVHHMTFGLTNMC